MKLKKQFLPDNALRARPDGLEVLVPLEDGEPCVTNLDRVEVRRSRIARLHFVVAWSRRQQGHDFLLDRVGRNGGGEVA